jgi:hypothetical protein
LVGHDNQDQRRRNDLRQRAGRCDHAGGDAAVIAVAQHDRQGDQPHGNHGCRDYAGRCSKQRADEDHRIGDAAAHAAEQLPDRLQQILGHARSFEYQAHEGEERNGQQRVVVHHAIDSLRQGLQKVRPEQPKLDANEREQQTVCSQRKGYRIAQQQQHNERGKHQRRHVVDDEGSH